MKELVFIPRVFLTPSIIEKRRPLSVSAKRAGWTGCLILLNRIPIDGRISIIKAENADNMGGVLRRSRVSRKFESMDLAKRSWTLDVLRIIRTLGKTEFSLHEVYAYEIELQKLYPRNRTIRDSVRRQLQVLRDLGLLEFLGSGVYRLISESE